MERLGYEVRTSSVVPASAVVIILLASIHLLDTFALQPLSPSSILTSQTRNLQLAQLNNHRNISEILDGLLRGYDNNVRPDFGGPPAVVEVDIMVRSMGPISEVDMTYSMDCYFRQSWVDRRLAFQGNKETLALSISMLQRIWKPDTYFYNGKQSYLHTITTPNKFVRLYQDGRVLYSSRLTIKAGCPMNLEDFPMDTQRCPLKFGSCEYSMLIVSFHLQRHMGNFLIQVYGPCVLLVVLSWVSFWLNREATADRVSLGITTVLTMTFLGLEARTDLPKVPYPTALDFFVFLSFAFIFATIIQFAVVHYFTKYGSGECYFSSDLSSDSSSDDEDRTQGKGRRRPTDSGEAKGDGDNAGGFLNTFSSPNGDTGTSNRLLEVIPLSACQITPSAITSSRPSHHHIWSMASCLKGTAVSGTGNVGSSVGRTAYTPTISTSNIPRLSIQGQFKKRHKKRAPRYNSVSKIDRASRIVFPVCFLAFNAFYWYSYLSRSKRIQQMRSGDIP
ncbi:gamma-aminobutyric acid receptor alpha-like isoform X3 [Cryptotermes secundus]|uniref:gamma-aminobutyric acid receptor alpha-like isoform X3 n=1 Tax=Cryptotermes secundus TaxID=105785 RepID=UPI000CD7D0FB|nr:gamma-aminobutyric acid receptor alpha-like isoform X3 [Cryptotermes secundus]